MGRPQSEKTTLLFDIFSKNKDKFVKDFKVLPPSNDVYAWCRKKIQRNGFNISEKGIYSAAMRWLASKCDAPPSPLNIEMDFEMTSSTNEETLNTTKEENEEIIRFSMKLEHNVWKTIEPVEIQSRRKDKNNGVRTYKAMQPGVWTNVIVDEIAKKKEISCAWSFKSNKCYSDKVKFTATCVTCSANLFGRIDELPNKNQPVTIKIEIQGVNQRRHDIVKNRSVRIVGRKADEIAASGKPAIATRRDIMANTTTLFKRPRGRVVTANAIRCSRYRRRQKQKLSPCVYASLQYLKWSSKYMNTIHMIGIDPFHIAYSTPDQLKLYTAYKKKNTFTKMSGDSTGGLVHKLERPGGNKSQAILLSTLAISDKFQVPVSTFVSEKNNGNFLTLWMSEWVTRSEHIPNQFTCDMSMAWLNAAARCFGLSASAAHYIDILYDLASGVQHQQTPPCYIRIDVAHFIKNVVTTESLKSVRKKVRDFFIRCVGILVKIDNIDVAREFIYRVLLVANSTTEGFTEDGSPVLCETYKTYIIQRITGDSSAEISSLIEKIEHSEEQTEDDVDEDEIVTNSADDESVDHTRFNDWLKTIVEDVKLTLETADNGDRDNIMYNTKFSKFFVKICKLLPLWSAICVNNFQGAELTASSGNVESLFHDLKLTHNDITPCSVDKFVQADLDALNGMIIDASQHYVEFIENCQLGADSLEITSKADIIMENTEESVLSTDNTEPIDSTIDDSALMEEAKNKHQEPVHIADSTEPIDNTNNMVVDEKTKNKNQGRVVITDNSHCNVNMNENECPACARNDLPTGAHICCRCGKNVHILPGCSVSCGDEEGYGETRVCRTCFAKDTSAELQTSKKKSYQSVLKEMNSKESWSKKRKPKIKRSKYLNPAPNWHLNTNIDKQAKIGILGNGNLSKTLHKVGKTWIGLKNTCGFDSITQLLAAAYAYVPSYRENLRGYEDEIFKISMELGSNENMRKINTMRAKLLHSMFKTGSCDTVSTALLNRLFVKTPSYCESSTCVQCKESNTSSFCTILVNNKTYRNDTASLEKAIVENFPKRAYCHQCRLPSEIVAREFGDQIFIELPNCGNSSTNFETLHRQQLSNLPVTLTLNKEKYTLFGVIVFKPPYLDHDIGHYIAAVKFNDTWEVFDDMANKSRFYSKDKEVIVHNLFYIRSKYFK